jgi:hypothetical protein
MPTKKNKAIFIVRKFPFNHPDEAELVPIGSEVDLSHEPIEVRARIVKRGLMEPTTEDALTIPEPEKPVEPPKLNKYGLPFGQVPAKSKK